MFCRRHVIGGILSTSAFGVLSVTGLSGGSAASGPPLVAAAASLRSVLPELVAAFAVETGAMPRLSFGSSGNLARQIRQGAPFELFLSADEDFVLDLARDRLTIDEGIGYASGRLALFVPKGSPISLDPALSGARRALEDDTLRCFAIANPNHAPYGRAAQETLERAELWDAIRPRLVFGENVSQAAQFAASGSCDGALISLSLAVDPKVAARGAHETIPQDAHAPVRHRMVLLPSAGEGAKRLYAFLSSEKAREVFSRHGFAEPAEG